MSDINGSRNLFSTISLGMVVQIVTITAFFAGGWYVMGERIENNTAATRDLRTQIAAFDVRIDAIDRSLATIEARVESMRDAMAELRRQGALRPITPEVEP